MDRSTVDIYETGVDHYLRQRRAYHPDRAGEFAARLPEGGWRLDLGCGPGHYVPHLGRPLVAADASAGMAAVTRDRHGVPALAADQEALPVRRGVLAGVWSSKSLQHMAADHMPTALADLHHVLAVDGVLDITLFAGDGTFVSDDDLPGRHFTLWAPSALEDLLVGAGFEIEELTRHDAAATMSRLTARARRRRTLADTVGPGMRLLVCGLNPSLYAADAGVGFARPGNRFWPAARAAGLVDVDRDPRLALRRHNIGMTDLVKRATRAASELSTDEYRAGLGRVERLVRWLRPRAVCFVGLAGWRAAVDRKAAAGVQPEGLGGTPVYVMPSTSGLNAATSLDTLTDHLRAAAGLADGT